MRESNFAFFYLVLGLWEVADVPEEVAKVGPGEEGQEGEAVIRGEVAKVAQGQEGDEEEVIKGGVEKVGPVEAKVGMAPEEADKAAKVDKARAEAKDRAPEVTVHRSEFALQTMRVRGHQRCSRAPTQGIQLRLVAQGGILHLQNGSRSMTLGKELAVTHAELQTPVRHRVTLFQTISRRTH